MLPKPSAHTKRYHELTLESIFEDEYLVIPHKPSEPRAQLSLWDDVRKTNSRNSIVITDIEIDRASFSLNSSEPIVVYLNDSDALAKVFTRERILIDISGLPHHLWGPILKILYINRVNTRVLYAEPEEYEQHKSPSSHSVFDLSSEFGGLSPLPGFAQLGGPKEEEKCIFVALLGFEGNRPRSLVYTLDPQPRIIPIVGVPGFKVEFPAYTVTSNQELFEEFQAYYDIRYSKASCPFETYEAMKQIRIDFPDYYMYIAPVGTKPHSIGAVLYSIANPEDTEIMYDHPIKKKGRTKGIGTIHIYDFGQFNGF